MECFNIFAPIDKFVNYEQAKFVNSSFRNVLSADKMNELLKEVHQPVNCEALVKILFIRGDMESSQSFSSISDTNHYKAVSSCSTKKSCP